MKINPSSWFQPAKSAAPQKSAKGPQEPKDSAQISAAPKLTAKGRKALAVLGMGLALSAVIPLAGPNPVFQAPAPSTCASQSLCFHNPVVPGGAADPGVINAGGTYYMVTTGHNSQGTFPEFKSTDLVHWKKDGALFPKGQAPKWAHGNDWAPEIHHVGNHYVAYFSANGPNGHINIGAATSPNIDGNFKDIGHPLVSNPHVGLIDPTFLHDNKTGKQYVYYKVDGNAIGQPSQILVSQVDAAGTRLIGPKHEVLRNNPHSWEGAVVEGPEVIQRGNEYYMFYSGNGYGSDRYAEGVARSSSPTGHFEKKGAPILHSDARFKGPGHASVVETDKGQDWLVYHAWEAGHIMQAPGRVGLLDAIHWGKDAWPHITGNAPSQSALAPS